MQVTAILSATTLPLGTAPQGYCSQYMGGAVKPAACQRHCAALELKGGFRLLGTASGLLAKPCLDDAGRSWRAGRDISPKQTEV